jgi:hypothetical protein
MDWRTELMTEEAFRYAAECRRLARLARPPNPAKLAAKPAIRGWEVQENWRDWLSRLHDHVLGSSAQLSPGRVKTGYR